MIKFFLIVLLSIFTINFSYADSHCNIERKEWISYLKKELAKDIQDVIYSKNECYINVVAYEGKTMEEHHFINSAKNRENFINPNFENSFNELFGDLFKEIETPPINWVPKNFRDEKKL